MTVTYIGDPQPFTKSTELQRSQRLYEPSCVFSVWDASELEKDVPK